MSKTTYQSSLVNSAGTEANQFSVPVAAHTLMQGQSGPIQRIMTGLHKSKLQGETDRALNDFKAKMDIAVGKKAIEITGETIMVHIIEQGAGALQASQERRQAKETLGLIRLKEGHAMAMLRQADSHTATLTALSEQARAGRTTPENYQRDIQRATEADHLVATHIDSVLMDGFKQTRHRFAQASDHASK